VYFWTTIRKNRSKYSSARGISEDDVTAILLRDLILGKDPQLAEESLLKLPALRKFDGSLQTRAEKDYFRRHLRKYVNIWLPDCPFEVSTTNRYTIVTHEAAATARRFIKKHEPIKYLCGYLVSMTPEEEEELDQSKRDFSIVMSSRKKTASLFMGPARFANHDCNANARLVTKGFDGMQVVAVRDIRLGEEITVTYGDNYFGEANCECLCVTCEKAGRNGWTSPKQEEKLTRIATPLIVLEKDFSPLPYSFRKTRKYSQLAESSPDTDGASPRKRRKVRTRKSAFSLSVEGHRRAQSMKAEPTEPSMRSELSKVGGKACSSPPIVATGKETSTGTILILDEGHQDEEILRASVTTALATVKKTNSQTDQGHNPAYQSRSFSSKAYSLRPLDTTAPEKVVEASSHLLARSDSSSKSSAALSVVSSVCDGGALTSSSPATTLSTSIEPGLDWKSTDPISDPASDSELSELSTNEYLDDKTQTVIRRRKKRGRPSKQKSQKVVPTIELERPTPEIRYPSDYIRTPLLLGESYSRWVDCKTCAGFWVQPNGYLTRKECPRCERHSKLYGYQWPKTDKRGKGDKEERVLDHRTVHRFLGPEEEALVKKRGRGVEGVASIAKPDEEGERSAKRVKRA
jgi:[histone H4]-N-methyl-L-lysine20 N-methyltransferase